MLPGGVCLLPEIEFPVGMALMHEPKVIFFSLFLDFYIFM
jgi:hypothetical protein